MSKQSKNTGKTPMYNLGKYLKSLRQDMGLSMHEVARRSNLTVSYISKIESGNIFKTVSAQSLVEFSTLYNISPALILERMGLVNTEEDELPGFSSYLRIKYKTPHAAVEEMKIAWKIVQVKYMEH